jgi:hypothetical protein
VRQLVLVLCGVAAVGCCSRKAGQGRRCWMGLLLLTAGAVQQVAAQAAQHQETSRQCPRRAAW